MPYASARQQRFAHAAASRGEGWAQKYTEHGDSAMREAKKHPKGRDRFGNKVAKAQPRYGNGSSGRRLVLEDVSKTEQRPLTRKQKAQVAGSVGVIGASGVGGAVLGTKIGHQINERRLTRALAEHHGWGHYDKPLGALGHLHKADVAKRRYEPEERRQRRIGMAQAGLLGAGGVLAFRGGRGIRASTRAMQGLRDLPAASAHGRSKAAAAALEAHQTALHEGVPRKAFVLRGRDAAQLGGGLAALGGAGALRQYAESRRGRAYG